MSSVKKSHTKSLTQAHTQKQERTRKYLPERIFNISLPGVVIVSGDNSQFVIGQRLDFVSL